VTSETSAARVGSRADQAIASVTSRISAEAAPLIISASPKPRGPLARCRAISRVMMIPTPRSLALPISGIRA